MKNKLIVLAVFFLLFAGCNSRPDIVIEEETMVNLLSDIHMAEGLLEVQAAQSRDDEYGQGVRAAVLEQYNISQERLDTSLVWYSQNLKYLIRIYNRVNQNLEEREQHWNLVANEDQDFGTSASGDSINLWGINPIQILDPSRRLAHRQWRIKADTAYYAGDTICWNLRIPSLPKGQFLQASISISRKGEKNVTTLMDGLTTAMICQDTTLTIVCAADSGVMIESIFAALDLMPLPQVDTTAVNYDSLQVLPSSKNLAPVFVEDISLLRLHRKQ